MIPGSIGRSRRMGVQDHFQLHGEFETTDLHKTLSPRKKEKGEGARRGEEGRGGKGRRRRRSRNSLEVQPSPTLGPYVPSEL